MEKRQNLVASLIRSLLGAANDNLVGVLHALGLASVAGSVILLLILVALSRAGEEDENLVLGLQAVGDASARTNELSVELGVDLQDVSNLIGESATKGADVGLGSLGLRLGALQLDLAILNLNLDVEALAQFLDV